MYFQRSASADMEPWAQQLPQYLSHEVSIPPHTHHFSPRMQFKTKIECCSEGPQRLLGDVLVEVGRAVVHTAHVAPSEVGGNGGKGNVVLGLGARDYRFKSASALDFVAVGRSLGRR